MEILQGQVQCSCGKYHRGILDDYLIEKGAVSKLAGYVAKYNCRKPFLIADAASFGAAGAQVEKNLTDHGIAFSKYIFPASPKPDEKSVGSVMMHYDITCDMIIAIGSGVINDISKIVANITGHPFIVVGTAPSMDGYSSNSSSMERDGLKVSLPSKNANVVIGDIDILKNAPQRMLISGLGDMLAKYVSICEWRLSHVITGEYYCEEIATLIRTSAKKCTDNALGLLNRDEEAIAAVFEGLILIGVAMNYAEVTRPASGVEHYFSHIWDMRALEFGTPSDFHGIQCGIGTLYSVRLYEQLKKITPDREKALAYAKNFDQEALYAELRSFIGKGGETMIAVGQKEGKYDPEKHAQRLDAIIAHWDELVQIMDEELISAAELEELMHTLGAPTSACEIGIDEELVPITFRLTKDIRNKYVLSQLCWDLGVLDEMKL